MKFHPKKCKVVPVAPPGKGLKDLFNKIFPLRKTFFYKLDDTELEFVLTFQNLSARSATLTGEKFWQSGGFLKIQSHARCDFKLKFEIQNWG